jgi:hypothetical protein
MSSEGETLQVSVLPYRCSIVPLCCVLVVAQPISEFPEGLMNYPVLFNEFAVNACVAYLV